MRYSQQAADVRDWSRQTAQNANGAQWAVLHASPMAKGLWAAVEVLRGLIGEEAGAGFPVEGNQTGFLDVCLHLGLLRVVELGATVQTGN